MASSLLSIGSDEPLTLQAAEGSYVVVGGVT